MHHFESHPSGLGQLAYDKRMRILAASQADNVPWESSMLRQGMLTYALLKDGIEKRLADKNDDGRISLSEWLGYGVARVPQLTDEIRKGASKETKEAVPVTPPPRESLANRRLIQRPALFDCSGRDERVYFDVR